MKSGRVVQGRWRSRLHPAVLTAHLQPVAAAADNGEKFYGNKFGVLMLNRLNFLKNQSRVSGGRGGKKKSQLPVIPWKSYVNHPGFHAREKEVHEQQWWEG